MKFILSIIILVFSVSMTEKTVAADDLKYIDAKQFKLIGKGFVDSTDMYCRLPSALKGKTRPPVWSLSRNCAGLAVRFHTNSPVIAAKWEVTGDIVMNHFAPSGIKGLDLYCFKDKKWQFVNAARPAGKSSSVTIISNMEGKDMEYMLYLPLYDGLKSLEIGVAPNAVIGEPLVDLPKSGKPVVIYGTSITQGGCASRAGMACSNILSRMLEREVVNLGFSGNGQLDLEVADFIGDIDASCFIMDCLPNCSAAQINEKYASFVSIIRKKRPDVPILMVENPLYPHMYFSQSVFKNINEKNADLRRIYLDQKGKGDRNIYYLKADKLIGDDYEGTVDGVHCTDLGFLRMAQDMYPAVKKLIKNK